jgi:hypothetical protein
MPSGWRIDQTSLQRVRNAAAELDHFEPALDIALGVGDHLAMFGGEQVRQLVHILLDERLEVEHDARAPLRIGGRPARLRRLGRRHGPVQLRLAAERDARLHLAAVGIEHVALARTARSRGAGDEILDDTHGILVLCLVLAASLRHWGNACKGACSQSRRAFLQHVRLG